MKTRFDFAFMLSLTLMVMGGTVTMAQQAAAGRTVSPQRPQGSCDIYAAAGNPCVAAHSTTRALYANYNGPLYQVLRQSDGKTLDIGVVQPSASPVPDSGGYADAGAQDRFCAGTYCWISIIYDQSPKHNDLTQAPRGGFGGPALGGFNNLPIADMAPVTIMGHKVYGVFIEPGMGLRQNDVKGTAVDDQAEGQYWVVNGKHFNSGCCFDYGNGEIDSRDDDNGTMETLYFGNATPWYSGQGDGPWIMTDQENNLVGCVNEDGSKGCPNLPSINWRFVTAIAKGKPHHWSSLGGDAQKGALSVIFDGPRVNATYDPMRKQGAILLGNGGDNSDGSQGTFYEGAMTAANTYPSEATDQLVQANIVAARYDVSPLSVTPATKDTTSAGPQTFTPGSSRDFTVTFTNTIGAPATGVSLSMAAPNKQWTSVASGSTGVSKSFAQPVAPGESVSATFKITSGTAAFNGDLVGKASWTDSNGGEKRIETVVQKVRNVSPVKINEFRVSSGTPANPTNSFIELYNAGPQSTDISNWMLTSHPAHQAIFSTVKIPAGTKLAAGGFYLLGLSNSGLSVPAHKGESILHVRSTEGMSVGDTIAIGSGAGAETHKIASLGTAASDHTTLWQPLPDGPVITVPAGSTNVPVESTSGFVVGQKIALGYGTPYPVVANTVERYEIATVTAVGKPGTQAYLAMEAPAGARNIQVTSLSNISVGDKIRLDVDSVGHGIETVTVTHVGTAARQTNLSAPAKAGATRISVRRAEGFAAGNKITVGTPASQEAVTVTRVDNHGPEGHEIEFTPALKQSHVTSEWVVAPGTGLDLAAPLQFSHAANLPFSDRGTGITFQPATAFAHSSNEPVQALGTGVTLDRPLANDHEIHAAVRDTAVKTAGYQGTAEPNQWFGGPEFTTRTPQFDRILTVEEGSIVLRDASGAVADSLNYGGLVDPWAAEGDQSISGTRLSGCYSPAPGSVFSPWSTVMAPVAVNTSAGRFPDGSDTDSNCSDFLTQAAATLSANSAAGATNIKVASTEGFRPGQTIHLDSGTNVETAVIAEVGTSGATTINASTEPKATILPVASVIGFTRGQTITIDDGQNSETAIISAVRTHGDMTITVSKPLAHEHTSGTPISGSGITLASPLTRAHANGTQIFDDLPTPGAPNQYQAKSR
ncbi:arabinofuranosidase catalytic domain-containing protein [Edaphobacter sp. 12200R-103]|uniref:arabinofuranosidase catalytic domain-containing protein n=1 Tax=Edaphobacter sp. 12200R-103 TaxID=2703788 RepID=UPI00138C4587|nr:arabinofuranosidase catalytic domain-containing protein [Edaphobacter sp. 12200R-103]QHS50453.1 alpha-N-arabinofuranosidase [Edaphobacter sp. 12200R-103]